ncbi:MAG: TIM44-like domain-containing protein [Humidesulfovibrio sp.]|nr:TIM44-like domain-containing protein [Humidesulfovibrio sp.]
MKMKCLLTLLVFALSCALLADSALARRLGGGSSFGSRSTYSRSYSPSSTPSSPSAPAQPGQMSPTGAPAQTAPLGQGMFPRLGWGLGGLLAGGFLGSMLFGHGGMGGGGIGLLDFLLIGLIVYFGVKLLSGRSGPATPAGQQDRPADGQQPQSDPHARAAQSWNSLRSQPQAPATPAGTETTGSFGVAPASEPLPDPVVPQGFSIPDFLEGAKTVYARLQHSWDRRDLNDIALFSTPEVLAEIKRQAASDPTPSKTELLLVNARMLEFREEEADTVATVLFDVLLREDASEDRPKQIREVWHFSRPTGDIHANWRLEGIQQLEG